MTMLQSYASGWLWAELDPDTGTLRRLPIWRSMRLRQRPDGWYGRLGSSLVTVYRTPEGVFLNAGRGPVPFDEIVRVDLRTTGRRRDLRITRGSNVLLEESYRRP